MPKDNLFDNQVNDTRNNQQETVAYRSSAASRPISDKEAKAAKEARMARQAARQKAQDSSMPEKASVYQASVEASERNNVSTPQRNMQTEPQRAQVANDNSGGKSMATPQKGATSGNGGGKKPPAKKRSGGNGGDDGSNNRGKKQKPVKKQSVVKIVFFNIVKAVFVLGCLGIMVAAIAAIPLMQWVISETKADDLNLLDLDSKKISQTSVILYVNSEGQEEELQPIYGAKANRIWVGIDQIPQFMQDAAIATEDKSFLTHHGFSVLRTTKAAFSKVFKGSSFGGSTIDQQLVKNLTGEKETDGRKGIERKILEIYRAWSLEKSYSKDTIMEAYLNTIPLSGTLVGVSTGAQQYFNKDVQYLTAAECATIVGITNAPGRYDPYKNPDACLTRRNNVLYFMYQDGYLTEEQFNEETAKPLGLYEGDTTEEQTTTSKVNSYFVDTLYYEVRDGLIANGIVQTEEEAYNKYYNGGLRIIATVDPEVQGAIEEIYEKGYGNQADGYIFPELTAPKIKYDEETDKMVEVEGEVDYTQSAMVVLDYNGAIKGIVGGIGEKTEDLIQNRATDSPRQVGSTMKVLAAYPLGIDSGVITYSSMLEDSPSQFKGTAKYNESGLPVYDWPSNYGNSLTNAPMAMTTAVAKSTNTVAVRVGERVGIDNMYDFLTSTVGVTSLTDEGTVNDKGYSSLVLGGMTHGISPYEMAGAAQMLGNDGVYTPVHAYTEVRDSNNNVLFTSNKATTQAIQPGSAFIMRKLMATVLETGGTAAGMKPTGVNEAVAKTGTAGVAGSETDRWFLGLTPEYISVVWWGYDYNQNIAWSAAAKTNPPAMAWKTVMEKLYADKTDQASFPSASDDIVEEMYCTETGYIATEFCPSQKKGYYLKDNVPDTCYLHDGTTATEEVAA